MKRLVFAILALSITPSAEAQFLRRIFGGRQQQVQAVSCYQQPVYQQQYYQPVNYVPVAAVPLATVPVAIDLQAYAYSVNAQAFQSFRDYQASKVTQEQAPQGATVAAAPVSGEGLGLTGAVVLKQRCASCHTSGKNPRFFDAQGNLLAGAPMQEMLERMSSDDPATRMPPRQQLPTREVMAVMNHYISGLTSATEKGATNEPTVVKNPFD